MAESPRQQFQDILKSFDTAMLVTRTPTGQLRGRPMAVARCDSDSDVWFVTDAESGKIDELTKDPHVAVVLQDGGRFLSLSGEARLSRDQAQVQDLWNEDWSDWFPNGAQDANLIALHVRSNEGEFWGAGSLKGLQYIFEAGKALLRGEEHSVDEAEHGHVEL